jgi:hypothetical protein
MPYQPQDFKNPEKLFEIRTREVRIRIQQLENSLAVVKHPISKAIILNELNNTTDDYVQRKFVSTRTSSSREEFK